MAACFVAIMLATPALAAEDGQGVNPWATGGGSTTATADGKPAGVASAAGPIPFWQAPAMPTTVIQGGRDPARLAAAGGALSGRWY